MSCNIEAISKTVEKRILGIFQKVKNIKKELEEVKLQISTLQCSKEYKELQTIIRSNNFQQDSEISEPVSKRKKIKLETSLETSTTDSPYYHFDESRGWQNQYNDNSTKQNFTVEDEYVVVYTDGACENNGKANAKAGIGIWFADKHPLNVSRPVQGKATNNTAEIQACVVALEILHKEGIRKVRLKTDSQFTISCITQWIKKWKKNDWKLATGGDVKNKEELVKLDNIRNKMLDVDWVHIRGHKGEKGNEEADKLAKTGAMLYKKN